MLFPHLSRSARVPFVLTLVILTAVLVALAALGWEAPLVAVVALGPPLVVLLYLYAADADRTLGLRAILLTLLLAIALGVGWVLLTGEVIARTHDVALGADDADQHRLLIGFGIPMGGAVLMLAPALTVRLLWPTRRDPLDGYVFGAAGAVVFTAAATLTRLAPQFTTGLGAEGRPAAVLLVQAGIQGVTLPLTAAALGGWVGVALWRGRPTAIAASVCVTLALFALMAGAGVWPLRQGLQFAVHAAIAVVSLLALRAAVPRPSPESTPERQLPSRHGVPVFVAALAVTAAAGVAAAVLATPERPRYVCPPDCGGPPTDDPVQANPRFYADDGAFSVQYPGPGSAYQAEMEPDGVTLEFVGGDTGTMNLFGLPAEGRTAKEITEQLIDLRYPDATTAYEIPNALVGYQPGYGVVVDDYPQDASGTFTRLRLIVMTAVKNDYALVAAAVGPYHEFTRDFGSGHPSAANLQLAMDMGKYVNSFRWGEPLG